MNDKSLASRHTTMSRLKNSISRDQKALIGVIVIIVEVFAAVFAPFVMPHDPDSQEYKMLASPSFKHLLGTDEFGRDLFSRIIAGARVSLVVGISSVVLAIMVGVPLGLVSGYFGGWVDILLQRIVDLIWSFPNLIIAVGMMAVLGPGLLNVIIAISVAYVDDFARISRSEVLSIREEEYVIAIRALGSNSLRVLVRHVLPNSMAPIIVVGTVSISYAILAESTLSFLGLGVRITTPTWGIILNGAREFFTTSWWLGIFPGLAIMVTVLSINFVGDWMRDFLDVKVREV